MRIICDELIKTAPMDAIISVNQSISLSRLVSLPAYRVVGRGGHCLFGWVSFPVIFVLFRLAPELSIFSGIIRFSCGFLLTCLAAMLSVSFFFFPPLGSVSLAARAVSALAMSSVMSSVSAICLLAVLRRPLSSSLRLSLFAPRRLATLPVHRVGGRGADGAVCLPHDVVVRGVALASCPCLGCGAAPWFICRASIILPVLLLLMRWRRRLERLRCDTTGAAACPMRGWRRGCHAGSFDVAAGAWCGACLMWGGRVMR